MQGIENIENLSQHVAPHAVKNCRDMRTVPALPLNKLECITEQNNLLGFSNPVPTA